MVLHNHQLPRVKPVERKAVMSLMLVRLQLNKRVVRLRYHAVSLLLILLLLLMVVKDRQSG